VAAGLKPADRDPVGMSGSLPLGLSSDPGLGPGEGFERWLQVLIAGAEFRVPSDSQGVQVGIAGRDDKERRNRSGC